ncbi:MAG: hypothetical protein JO180_08555 [Gemmatirosa sp.]|nr:hypothetical protein [Gemmatirosa sp.]
MSVSLPVPRPLPARPSLEFERKEAKALLRRLRAGDPEAFARARAVHPRIATSPRVALADAQWVLAREYGFASWPRLVRYLGDVERGTHRGRRSDFPPDFYERSVRGWLAAHRDRREFVGRALAAYVPRFYGMRVDDVFAATVTEDDVRLAMARQYGFPSWSLLIARATAAATRPSQGEWEMRPVERAERAIGARDLDALRRVVEAHPALLQPSDDGGAFGRELLLHMALRQEEAHGVDAMRAIVEWLVAQGLDPQRALNVRLCGHMRMQPASVRHALDRGADPDWVAPNGIPVLEHALIRYWNGDAVDVLAARATPRQALWIAAGLGDVDAVRRSLDARGRPLPAATRLRPAFDAVGPSSIPSLPDPDDEELLVEAFFVAMLNGRTAVLDAMAARGTPVNSMIYGSPLINIAVGNAWTLVVEALVRCGADLDLRGWRPTQSAREMARELFEQRPEDADRRRIAAICGLDPDAILAERAARPLAPPTPDAALQLALDLAADDAFRRGQADVGAESLLFGLLGAGGLPLGFFTRASRMDHDRFRSDFAEHLPSPTDRVAHPPLPLRADAHAALDAATAFATERRSETVQGLHVLWGLTRAPDGPVAELLARYGSSVATLGTALTNAL